MDDNNDSNDFDRDDEPTHGIARWIPAVVVLITVGSFIALACTAYRAGTQSLNEDDLPVVEADSTPMKEKPLDPGGMKFPNQDKTVFETFANNPTPTPKVERVLPNPEEPMPRQLDTSETSTFVKAKEQPGTPSKPEQITSATQIEKTPSVMSADTNKPIDSSITAYAANSEPAPAPAPTPVPAPVPAPAKAEPAKPAAVAPAPVPAKVEPAKPAAKPEPKPAAKLDAAKVVSESASDNKTKAQLGAYRSEKEAKDAWDKMQKKFNELGGRTPVIVKADLGDKGIYFRLRVGGFENATDGKAFCKELSAKGQACILQ